MPDALELLTTRRSFKPAELSDPGPTPAEIDTLLTVASRVPDHGKLAPWRFIVFEGDARRAAGAAIVTAFRAKYPDAKTEHVEAERERLTRAPLVIAVVRRAACENSGMGASALGRCRRDESRLGCACAGLRRELDHRMVRLRSRRARCAWPKAARAHRGLCAYRPPAGPGRRSSAPVARGNRKPLPGLKSLANAAASQSSAAAPQRCQ